MQIKSIGGKPIIKMFHQLVADMFLKQKEGCSQVHHRNSNPLCNKVNSRNFLYDINVIVNKNIN